jgi:hypothetical protein
MKERIVLSGANGFIGRYLTRYFAAQKKPVSALIHKNYKAALAGVDYRQFDLQSFSGDIIPLDTKVFIHCAQIPLAYDREDFQKNIQATQRILQLARKKGVEQVVYFSSFLADVNAPSRKGRFYYQMEKLFDQRSDLIIRLPLVIGKGGTYQQLENMVFRSNWIPILGLSHREIYTITLDKLPLVLSELWKDDRRGAVNIVDGEPQPLISVLREITKNKKEKTHFIPISPFIAKPMIRTMEKVYGKRTPISFEDYFSFHMLNDREVEKV